MRNPDRGILGYIRASTNVTHPLGDAPGVRGAPALGAHFERHLVLLQLHVPVHARHLQRRTRHGAAKLDALYIHTDPSNTKNGTTTTTLTGDWWQMKENQSSLLARACIATYIAVGFGMRK